MYALDLRLVVIGFGVLATLACGYAAVIWPVPGRARRLGDR